MENFHERLKSLRVAQNLTQQELADKLFVSRQAVSNWENDKNFPDLKSLVLAFLVPIAGLAFSFFVLKNDRKFNYPSWSKYTAIVAVFFQIIMIGIIILSIPTSTEQFDYIKNTLETP